MIASTSHQRIVWAPACTPKGPVYLDAYRALDAVFQAHAYAPRKGVTGAFNCRHITGGTGYSLHAYGPGDPFTFWTGVTISTSLAVDVNWDVNPYGPVLVTDMSPQMLDAVERVRTRNGQQVWRCGARYKGNKDAMHFEIVCDPHDLATGIDATSLPGAAQPPKDEPLMVTDDDAKKIEAIVNKALDARLDPDGKGNLLVRLRDSAASTEARVKRLLALLPKKG